MLKRTVISSIIAMFVCLSLLLGSTFAWFTDYVSNTNNVIKSGNVAVELWHASNDSGKYEQVNGSTKLFLNSQGGEILWEPGASTTETFTIKNVGSLAFKYELRINAVTKTYNELGKSLTDVINLKVADEQVLYNDTFKDGYTVKGTLLANGKREISVDLEWFASENDNTFNVKGGLSVLLGIDLVATQLNSELDGKGTDYDKDATYPTLPDTYSGEIDISWYAENPDAQSFALNSTEQFFGFKKLIDGINTNELNKALGIATVAETNDITNVNFEDKEIKLTADVNLAGLACFDPIGSYRHDQSFKGVFDGQGHTIYNLSQNTWELDNGYYYSDCGLGLFGQVEGATIKNLIIDGAEISGESALCGTIAAVAHDTTFENITVKNANVADYQYYAGGILGWASGEITVKNCNIDQSTNVAAQWGDFDNSIGGVIGGASSSAKILIKDTTVACRIDSYNDVTSANKWYAYRRAGMLIGNTNKTADDNGRTLAAAPQLTCQNVTVIYGEWANYTYCEFAGTDYPYVRVQAGVSNSAYSNPRYGHPTDANGKLVVDDDHVHNEGEDHHILCAFDQLYGGGQGVYGTPTHIGVTVVYNNK